MMDEVVSFSFISLILCDIRIISHLFYAYIMGRAMVR